MVSAARQVLLQEHHSPTVGERETLRVVPGLARELQRLGAVRLATCYNCGTCTAICTHTDEMAEFPRKLIRYAIMGVEQKILSSAGLWLCHDCGDCSDNCPRDADPATFMMAARRYATKKYALAKFATPFYSSPKLSVLSLIFATAVALSGIMLLRGSITFSPVDLQLLLSFEIIHDVGLWLGASIGISAALNLVMMARHLRPGVRAGRQTSLPRRAKAWTTALVTSVARDALAQLRYRKCKRTGRYIAHMAVFWGFLGLFLATLVDFVIGLGKIPLFPIPPQRVLGIAAGVAFTAGASYFLYKRVRRDEAYAKVSHISDWIFLGLLLAAGVTGLLLTLSLYMNWHIPAYTLYLTHLLIVFDLLVLAPFTKFAHAVYRPLALWMSRTAVAFRTVETPVG